MEIKLVHVTKSFGAKQVIQPTSFVIQSGSLTTLLEATVLLAEPPQAVKAAAAVRVPATARKLRRLIL